MKMNNKENGDQMKDYIKQKVKRELSNDYEIPINAIKCPNCKYYYDDKCDKWDCELEDDPDEFACRCFEPNE